MKLWRVVQWGNPVEGGNGADTQCIISAPSMKEAIQKGEEVFLDKSPNYMNGKAHNVQLLGQDDRPDGPPVVIIWCWEQAAINHARNPSWGRIFDSDEWEQLQE